MESNSVVPFRETRRSILSLPVNFMKHKQQLQNLIFHTQTKVTSHHGQTTYIQGKMLGRSCQEFCGTLTKGLGRRMHEVKKSKYNNQGWAQDFNIGQVNIRTKFVIYKRRHLFTSMQTTNILPKKLHIFSNDEVTCLQHRRIQSYEAC